VPIGIEQTAPLSVRQAANNRCMESGAIMTLLSAMTIHS